MELSTLQSCDDVIKFLIAKGIPHNPLNVLQENLIDGEVLRELNYNDLEKLFPKHLGIVKKLWKILDPKQKSNDENNNPGCSSQSKISGEISNIPMSEDNGSHPLMEINCNMPVTDILTADDPCTSNMSPVMIPSNGQSSDYAPTLPKFSIRVQSALKSGHISLDFDKLVEECAYHIVSVNLPFHKKSQYDRYGRLMYEAYPCIRYPGGKTEYSVFCRKLSQKIRNIRWKYSKKLEEEKSSKFRRVLGFIKTDSTSELTVDEQVEKMKEEILKGSLRDEPLIKKLFKDLTHYRRSDIAATNGSHYTMISEKWPLLLEVKYLLLEIHNLFPEVDCNAEWNSIYKVLTNMYREKLGLKEDRTPNVECELQLINQFQKDISLGSRAKSSQKINKAILFCKAEEIDLSFDAKYPPTLAVISHDTLDNHEYEAYLFLGTDKYNISGFNFAQQIMFLIGIYYVFDLTYPKNYQLLPFLQNYLLKDNKGQCYRGSNLTKYEKFFLETRDSTNLSV